jgi:3-oxoacyl-[acyl-carrier-protein] synthase II
MIDLSLLGRAASLPEPERRGQGERHLRRELATVPAAMAHARRFDRYASVLANVCARATARRHAQTVCGLVATSERSCHETNHAFHRTLLDKGPTLASPLLFPYTLPGAAASEIAAHLDLRGPYLVGAGGPAAALASVLVAADLLASGAANELVIAAADVLGDSTLAEPAFAPEGLAFAEGAAALWLGLAEGPAARFGIEGVVAPGDGDPARAIEEALERAAVTPAEVARVFSASRLAAQRDAERGALGSLREAEPVTLGALTGDCGAALGALALQAACEEAGTSLIMAADLSTRVVLVVRTPYAITSPEP